MLFPDYLNATNTEKGHHVLQMMQTFYEEGITLNQARWSEADMDNRFMVGDQSLWQDLYGNLPQTQRRQLTFNRIRSVVNMVDGYQREHRKSMTAVPIENGDTQTADQLTKVLMWATNNDNILHTVSDAFHGSLVTGMSLLQVWMDYRQDPISGNIRVDNIPYNAFLIDPYFKKQDLSDCNYIWKRTFLTREECASLMPDHKEEIMTFPTNNGDSGDGKFQFMPQAYNFSPKNFLTYDEFYYRSFRKQTLLVDVESGESMEWRSTDQEALEEFLDTYPQIQKIKQEIPTVKLAIVVQGRILFDDYNPAGIDSYPFVPVTGYYNPQIPYLSYSCQGMVRGLRDSQYLYNRRKIIELDIFESQINSGWIYKENSLVNPADVFMNGQGRGLALKKEASMDDVRQIQSPQIPPTTLEVSKVLGEEINRISGVNEELTGMATDDKAGVLSMLRQGAGLTTLRILFDQLDLSQKVLGKMLISLIQNNFTPGKIKRITEEDPTPEFYNKNFGLYDCVVEDGLNTATQRQMQFTQMIHLRELGVPITDQDLLEAATLQNKTKIIENMMQQQQQVQEQQQQQQQLAMQEQQAKIELAQARTMADEGLGRERMSRIAENQQLAVERSAEAQKDRDLGMLHYAKALKELEDIDISQLEKLILLAKQVKDIQEVT